MPAPLTSRRATLGLLLGTAAGASLAATSATVAIDHARGRTDVPARPLRVVVYDLGALDALQALGVPVAGGPRAQLPDYLAGYAARYVPAGSLFDPDFDALSRIRPDLIIVGGRSAARFETLSRIAPTLDFSVKGGQMLQDMARNVTALAHLYDRQAQGEALVARMQREVDALRPLAGRAEPGLLLMAFNERIAPQAPGSRFGFLFDVLGARSALLERDLPPRGTSYTFDDVARLNPAWIYVIDRNTATGSAAGGGAIVPSPQVFDNAAVKATEAGRRGQVVFLDPKGWYLMGSVGPTALLGNVAQLRAAYEAAARR